MALRKRNLLCSSTPKVTDGGGTGARLSWGPGEAPPADQVNVKVENRLASSRTDIEHRAVAVLDPSLAGNLSGHQMTASDHLGILRGRFLETSNVFFGDHQHVGGCLGMDVLKGKRMLVFIDFLRGELTGDDAAKQAVCHGPPV